MVWEQGWGTAEQSAEISVDLVEQLILSGWSP